MTRHCQCSNHTFGNRRRVLGPLNIVTLSQVIKKWIKNVYFPAYTNPSHNERQKKKAVLLREWEYSKTDFKLH